jgi:hypothetical protein
MYAMLLSSSVVDSAKIRKAKWTPTEDEQLRKAVQALGTNSWNLVSNFVPSRTGKQCRERWLGQLEPSLSREIWLPEEDLALVRAHAAHGNRWTAIAAQLRGRSPISVKNRWNWVLRDSLLVRQMYAQPQLLQIPEPQPEIQQGKRPPNEAFEPLALDGELFGQRFHDFQARMLVPGMANP